MLEYKPTKIVSRGSKIMRTSALFPLCVPHFRCYSMCEQEAVQTTAEPEINQIFTRSVD